MILDFASENTVFKNRTRKYLLPSFNLFDRRFKEIYRDYSFVGLALEDAYHPELYEDSLCLLIDGKKSVLNFNHPTIKANYFAGEKIYGRLHAVVVQLPEELLGIKEKFVEGKYSEMYPDLSKVFLRNLSEDFKAAKAVLSKSAKYRTELGISLSGSIPGSVKIPIDNELDIIPRLSKEIFNYRQGRFSTSTSRDIL